MTERLAGKHTLDEITVTVGYVDPEGRLVGWRFRDPCGECNGYDATTEPHTISGWSYDRAEAEQRVGRLKANRRLKANQ